VNDQHCELPDMEKNLLQNTHVEIFILFVVIFLFWKFKRISNINQKYEQFMANKILFSSLKNKYKILKQK